MSTLREQLAAALTDKLPTRKYRVLPSLGTLDRIPKPTIQFEQTEIEPSPDARGLAMVSLDVHVITHREGTTPVADDSIDELGVEVFEALASIGYVNVTQGVKRIYNGTNLSYVISTQIITERRTT